MLPHNPSGQTLPHAPVNATLRWTLLLASLPLDAFVNSVWSYQRHL